MRRVSQCIAGLFFLAALFVNLPLRAEVTVSQELLEEKVVQYIKDTTPLDDPKASLWVEVVRLPQEPLILDGTQCTILMTDGRSTPLTLRTIVQVTISTESETRIVGIPVKMAVEKPVWVVTRLIPARQAISAKNVALQTKRLDHDEPYVLGSGENPILYSARINLTPGAPLDMRKLTVTPAIYRNSEIHVIARMANGIQISFFGKAMDDGVVGRNIRVMQTLANRKRKIYTGQVVDKNTVSIDL